MVGADESLRLLAYLGATLVERPDPKLGFDGGPFWRLFRQDMGRITDHSLWERIVQKGGDEGTAGSLRKRIRILKKAGVRDPRDGRALSH